MIFDITPDQVGKLDETDLRTAVGLLAEEEVRALGHSSAHVTYGGHQNAIDGGTDVRVELPPAEPVRGYLPRPAVVFQVKTSDLARKGILEEMAPGGELRDAILTAGRQDGAYVIVSSGSSASDTALTKRRNAMAEAIAGRDDISGLVVDYYDRRRLASWINQHPGVVAWVRERIGEPLTGWRPYADWSSSPQALDAEYFLDNHARIGGVRLQDGKSITALDGLERIRGLLGTPCGVVRLVGLSGVGKTRFVQALFDDRVGASALAPALAVYCDLSDGPNPVPLELASELQAKKQRCVLIVDNCGSELHRKLTNIVRRNASRLSLITVEYDIAEDEPENTDVFELKASSSETLSSILERQFGHLSAPDIRTIANLSEGNARIALALARTAREGESVSNLKDADLFKRLFRQRNEDNPALLRAACAMSLVYSFDGETLDGGEAELPALAALAGQSVSDFHAHVAELQRRQLVQRRSRWRALLPHALAHKLAKQALQDFPTALIEKHLRVDAPPRLLKSFAHRLGWLHDSPAAQALVGRWLEPGGWLYDLEALDDFSRSAFEYLAPVIPEKALATIELTAERSPAFLTRDNPLSRRTALTLRSLAYDPNLFDRAIGLIAQATRGREAKAQSDGASIFSAMFLPYLSGTHAPIEQRASVLRALGEGDEHDRFLAMLGLTSALEYSHFSSSYPFEFGAHKRDYGHMPEGRAQIAHWYRTAIALCAEFCRSEAPLAATARDLFAKRFSGLARRTGCHDEVLALAKELHRDGGWPEGWVSVRYGAQKARRDGATEIADELDALTELLRPRDLSALIVAYVLPEQWSRLDLAEADFDDDQKYEKAQARVVEVCRDIGGALGRDLSALKAHLPVLVAARSQRVRIVAEAVGRHCQNPGAAWPLILREAQANDEHGNMQFAAGFISGLAESDADQAETFLEAALRDPSLHPHFVMLQNAAGFGGAGFDRLLRAVEAPSVPVASFSYISVGPAADSLPSADFQRLLGAVIRRDGGVDQALYAMRTRRILAESRRQSLDETDRETARILLTALPFSKRNNRGEHGLDELISVSLRPGRDEGIARGLCQRLLEAIEDYRIYAWDYGDVIAALAADFPEAILDTMVDREDLGPEGAGRLFHDFREERPCPFDSADDMRVLAWAREAPERRIPRLLRALRLWRPDAHGRLRFTPLAAQLLDEASPRRAALEIVRERFCPMSWGGSLADILASRLPLLDDLAAHTDIEIAKWAGAARKRLEVSIQLNRVEEAKLSRRRDERFE